eukprot:TRINITY_DN386_c0_g1_i2.p2 TRINITY_DN386_c0_g1~~TRINITY_DN386_c0_g1_i2.p2  ORF type:complete len:836 (+),score=420.59 TRINITY_DN386_c0_g1_i2:82-2589(+)
MPPHESDAPASSHTMPLDEVLKELAQFVAKDKPDDVLKYIGEYVKARTSVASMTPIEQATVLCDAAAAGNAAELKVLCEQVNPDTSDYDKRSALHLAAEEGHLEAVKVLVEAGAHTNCADRWGTTPLSGAVQNGHSEVADYLKAKGALLGKTSRATEEDGAAAMCKAAGAGNLAKLKELVAGGVSVNAADYDYRSAIHLAAEEGFMECVQYLVDSDVDFNCQDRWGTTPLTGAENCGQQEVAAYLREKGAKRTGEMGLVRKASFSGSTQQHDDLIKACAAGDLERLQKLVQNGADVNKGDYDSRYPLHLAAEDGHLECVRFLHEQGADLDVKDRWGNTPLRGAIRNTHNDVADFLKDSGAVTDKFPEVPTYAGDLRRTKTFFEGTAAQIDFPKGELLPLDALLLRIRIEYGILVNEHCVLQDELRQIVRTPSDAQVAEYLSANPVVKVALEHDNIPNAESDFTGDEVFFYDDFVDLVLAGHSMHQKTGTAELTCGTLALATIVLDRLQIHNWNAFVTNLRAIYDHVLDETPNDGANAQYIPELKDADSEKFAVSVCTVDGQRMNFGDTDDFYSVQSVGKTFAYTRALQQHGQEWVHKHVGQEPSGRAFNDFALTRAGNPFNPVTNAGAIVTCSMIDIEIKGVDERLVPYKQFVSDMAGGMEVGDCLDVYASEQGCAFNNYALANFMKAQGTFPPHVVCHESLATSVEFYLRVCSTRVSTPLLANVAATYANYGTNPLTGKNLMTESEVKQTLQILSSCGMYDFSGEWACTIGMPAKSGVSGEIFVVVPGVLGMCVWSPKLDVIGNSVRGIRLCKAFAEKFRFSVLDLLFRAKEAQ